MIDHARRRSRLTRVCLALPEASAHGPAAAHTGTHVRFVVGRKTFAYYLDDHHGDGIRAVSVRVGTGANDDLIAEAPERFDRAMYMHHHGWVCLRLDLPDVDWDEVADLVEGSYRLQAPMRLVVRLDG